MKKINWKILILTSFVCVLPMILGVAIYDKMPEQMPVHFNINNEVDRYASKNFALFGLPIIMLAMQIFTCLISDISENKKGKEPKIIAIAKWIIPVLTIVIYIITIQVALGNLLDVRKWIMLVLSVIYILIGNYMPKVSYEQMKGKMHPMPRDEKKYRKMIRKLGYTFVIFGFAMLASVFFKPAVSFVVVMVMIIVLLVESILIYIKK